LVFIKGRILRTDSNFLFVKLGEKVVYTDYSRRFGYYLIVRTNELLLLLLVMMMMMNLVHGYASCTRRAVMPVCLVVSINHNNEWVGESASYSQWSEHG